MNFLNKKVLILGGAGMLGKSFYDLMNVNCDLQIYDIDCNETWIKYCDIRNFFEVQSCIKNCNPDLIINLAAMTDLEDCERRPFDAFNTNSIGVKNIVDCIKNTSTVLIHISTAGVFDGKKDSYIESDPPNPINIYGYSKYIGELFALEHQSSYVFRAGWMMGNIWKDKKFVKKFLNKCKSNNCVKVVTDKLGTPTYTLGFAKTILHYVSSKLPFGLYHNVGNGNCSRFEVAEQLIKNLNLSNFVEPCDSTYYQEEYFATRPKSEILINDKLQKLNMNLMNDWSYDLKNYCQQIINESYILPA